MYVIKRDGRKEKVLFDKITARVSKLAFGLSDHVEPVLITQAVIAGVYPGVTTVELDTLAAETAASFTIKHPDYAILAARIAVSNLHKQTKKTFSDVMTDLHDYINPRTGEAAGMVSDTTYATIMKHKATLDSHVIHERDNAFNFFGFKTLTRSYLLKINGQVAERPQHMYMRVAVGIHGEDIDAALETYDMLSQGFFSHASPTMFNAGTPRDQLSSCFLLQMKDDSIEGIYDTLKTCAMISKTAGGIGLSIHNIRASGSYIAGTNGNSNGLVPMLRVFNNTARYVDQGGNKRPGAFACYLEPWHADVFSFLDLRKNTGMDEARARDLFYALWVPDLFMERVQANGKWTLMCPKECPGLSDCHGEDFKKLYEKYEAEGKGRETIEAQKLWFAIVESQTETGTPYMLYKDACNAKSNQKNLGTIKCSNLCTEIVEYTAPDEVAVCNLASLVLNRFVDVKTRKYDFAALHRASKIVAKNLNKIIDINFYPVPEARKSNMRHRPIGIGVQGLADTFALMRFPFDSPEAKLLNRQIFETVYHAALEASCECAAKDGHYESYPGSPLSEGVLQYDMWGVTPTDLWDWEALKAKIKEHGTRNSLLLAPMPTASTAQILGNNEACEPFTNNIYTRRVLSGEFQVVNKHLLKDLIDAGLWDDDLKMELIAANGSIQETDPKVSPKIAAIPAEIKALYKTVWELSQKVLIDMAADRGAYIDQSQSFNVHIGEPNFAKLTSMHFYGWKKGLKTGMYYLRTRAAASAIQFTVDKAKMSAKAGAAAAAPADKAALQEQREAELYCSLSNPEACEMCSA